MSMAAYALLMICVFVASVLMTYAVEKDNSKLVVAVFIGVGIGLIVLGNILN